MLHTMHNILHATRQCAIRACGVRSVRESEAQSYIGLELGGMVVAAIGLVAPVAGGLGGRTRSVAAAASAASPLRVRTLETEPSSATWTSRTTLPARWAAMASGG